MLLLQEVYLCQTNVFTKSCTNLFPHGNSRANKVIAKNKPRTFLFCFAFLIFKWHF